MNIKKIAASVLSGIIAITALTGCSTGSSIEASSSKISTATVTLGDLKIGLVSDGRVALPVTNLNFELTGTVSRVYVKNGDSVKAGDLLAELDDLDYSLILNNALNNLEKANVAYEDAVRQSDYSIKNSELSLSSTEQKMNAPFDSYTYDIAVKDAMTMLERRKDELKDAEKALKEPFDDYTYQNTIKESTINLDRKKADLEETKKTAAEPFDDYTYRNNIIELEISLERKTADLNEAKLALETAKKDTGSSFNSYNYEKTISSAETNYSKKAEELTALEIQLAWARTEYTEIMANDAAEAAAKEEAANKVKQLETSTATARKATEEAAASLATARNDLTNAINTYNQSNNESLIKAVNDAEKKVAQAQQTVTDAERALNKAKTDMERAKASAELDPSTKIKNAQNSVDDAQRSLDKAIKDLERAAAKAAEDAQTKLESAKLSLTDAEASLNKANNNLMRASEDYKKNKSDTTGQYDLQKLSLDNQKSSTSSISNALFNIEDSKLKVEEAENNIEKLKVYAPIDGIIMNVSLKEGEKAAARDSSAGMILGMSGGNSNFITLCDPTEIYMTASITEGDIVSVEQDQTIKVTVDSLGDEEFLGKVTFISNIPTTDQNGITTYAVTCKLDDPSSVIRDGMNALINFIKKEKSNVLIIPNKAVFIEDNKQYVNVATDGGKYEKRQVTCGLSDGSKTEVVKGLEAGEIVYIGKITTDSSGKVRT